jgi:lysophospholipase L1-like esterase
MASDRSMLTEPGTLCKKEPNLGSFLSTVETRFFAKGHHMTARKRLMVLLTLGMACLLFDSLAAAGQEKKSDQEKKPNTAVTPKLNAGFMKRHEGFLEIAKKGDINVLLMGDSITDAWRSPKSGKPVFDKYFEPLKTANFGIGGDRTEGVLWRIENGELEGYTPKLMMLMIGTNNIGGMKKDGTSFGNTPEEIAEGIKAIVDKFRNKFPQAKVLLLGVFPRNVSPDSAQRKSVNAINKIISKYDDGKSVRYLDIGDKFLAKDGTLPADVMPDALHPNTRGYEIWAEAVMPTVHELLGTKK